MISMKDFVDWIYPEYKKKVTELEKDMNEFIDKTIKIFDDLKTEIALKEVRINRLNKLIEHGWDKPDDWNVYNPDYKTRDNLKVPPNTFITSNDRKIKAWIASKGYQKMEFFEMIWKLEQDIFNLLRYKKDVNPSGELIEEWRAASEVFQSKADDCDGHALLFQACMHILGYGDRCVVMVNGVDIPAFKGGHAYNKVKYNDLWVVVDPTNPSKYRDDTWKYDLKLYSNLNWFFNYWGTYRCKDNTVLK